MFYEDAIIAGVFALAGVFVGSSIGYYISKKIQDRQFKKEKRDKLEKFYDQIFEIIYKTKELAENFNSIELLPEIVQTPPASILIHVKDTTERIKSLALLIKTYNSLRKEVYNIIFNTIVSELGKNSNTTLDRLRMHAGNIINSLNFVENVLLGISDDKNEYWFKKAKEDNNLNIEMEFPKFFKLLVSTVKDNETIINLKIKRNEIIEYCKIFSDFIENKLKESLD